MPTKEFVDAVLASKIPALDGRGQRRDIAVLSIASEFSFQGEGLWRLFLTNLQNISYTLPNSTRDNLARHLVATVMTLPTATADNCSRLSTPYGARCVTMPNPIFTADNYHYKSPPFYGLSFAKVLTILDALTLGVDVFFLDGDQVFFRNPLPYMLARDIDVLVSGDCMARSDTMPADRFPPINSNIGVLYFRSKPIVVRAVYNWLMHLQERASRGNPTLDQSSFNGAMEWTSADMGNKVMSVAMLRGDAFPHWCMGACGCDTEGVALMQMGRIPRRLPDSTCELKLVRQWYNYHVPCCGDMNQKSRTMQSFLDMYERLVGPVNALSEHFEAI